MRSSRLHDYGEFTVQEIARETAVASGENAAVQAARQAITCPLLEEGGITGARGLLINITGSSKLGLHEVNEACTLIAEATRRKAAQHADAASRGDGPLEAQARRDQVPQKAEDVEEA